MKPSRLLETKALLVIAMPLIFAYLADVLMIITAKMVVGRLGAMELAAAGISTDLSYQMCIVLMGFFSVVGVLVSEAQIFFNQPMAFPDFAAFERQVIGVTHTRHVLSPETHAEVQRRFTTHQTPDGVKFRQPLRVDLLRKPG